MNITQKFLSFTLLGAEWVLWLLIALSVVSVTIMIERGLFFARFRFDLEEVGASLKKLLKAGKVDDAVASLKSNEAPEAVVLRAGLAEAAGGPEAVGEAMLAEKARQKLRLERNLAVLGTLGNNTPFIGLFGTVLGIIKASKDLAGTQSGGGAAASAVMAGVFEALIATAVGLMVAIPAVIGFNYYQRRVRAVVGQIDSLAHLVLSVLHGESEAGKSGKGSKASAGEGK